MVLAAAVSKAKPSRKPRNKTSMVGVSTLIIFIASILIAATAAGVILRTQTDLQMRALDVGSKAKKSVALHFQVLALDLLEDPYDNDYDVLRITIRLGPGSDEANLNKTLFDISGHGKGVAARFSAKNTSQYFVNKPTRAITQPMTIGNPILLRTDLTHDNIQESLVLLSSTQLALQLSNGTQLLFLIPNISAPPVVLAMNQTITLDSFSSGTLSLQGTVQTPNTLHPSEVQITISPASHLVGYGGYATKFLRRTTAHPRPEIFVYGDLLEVTVELQEPVKKDSEYLLSIKKQHGSPHRLTFVIPDVLQGPIVKLYP
ncbi:MAG: hypothetical protein QW594_00115 [Candidatus Woesearchaeota archaeon]